LGNVVVDAAASSTTIARSQLVNFTETGATSGAGNNALSQNVVTGAVDLQGNSGPGLSTADVVDHNTFQSVAPVMLKLTNSYFTQVRDNTFYGDGPNQIGIEARSNSAQVVVANNHIELTGAGTPIAIALVGSVGAGNILTASVLDNEISTGNHGTGVYCNLFGTGAAFAAQIEGNDFHGNLVGVDIFGVAGPTGTGNIDLGGGSNSLGTSKGGNNFRGFDGAGGHFAIILRNTDANIGITASYNAFDIGVTVNSVVKDGDNGGTGFINASIVLNKDGAFVQNLYIHQLGRAADIAEVNSWLSNLPAIGRNGVVHGILYSSESINRIVDHFYRIYLGRDSSALERAGWVAALQGGTSIGQVEAGFLTSPEFLSRIHTEFVQALYLNILRRSGTTAELDVFRKLLPVLGMQGLAASFTGSTEQRTLVVTDYFKNLLHRAPGPNEAEHIAGLPGDLLALEALVLGSDEFYNKG
jgi:hypothetical protein